MQLLGRRHASQADESGFATEVKARVHVHPGALGLQQLTGARSHATPPATAPRCAGRTTLLAAQSPSRAFRARSRAMYVILVSGSSGGRIVPLDPVITLTTWISPFPTNLSDGSTKLPESFTTPVALQVPTN